MPRMSMVRGDPRREDCKMARKKRGRVGEDVGYFAASSLHRGVAAQIASRAASTRPSNESGIVGSRSAWAPMGLGPSPRSSSPDYDLWDTTRSCRGARPAATGRAANSFPGRDPHAVEGHLRRARPQPEPEALFTHVSGLKTVIPSNPYDPRACS